MKKLLLTFFNIKRAVFCFIFFLSSSLLTLNAQYLLYGVTSAYYTNKNVYHKGTIFSYNPITNQLTDVFIFNATDGYAPEGKLLYASDGLLYGMTNGGGSNGKGTVFSFNPRTNTETVLINCIQNTGYANNGDNALIQGKDGLLYGTFCNGGTYSHGVLFSYNIQTHKDSIRCNFTDSTSLSEPYMELWQDTASGMLYGVTEAGGLPNFLGVIYGFNPATNKVTNYFIGSSPNPFRFSGGFTQASNGLLYAMSIGGGSNDSGTIYSFNLRTHSVQIVLNLSKASGSDPDADELFQYSNGLFYGTTYGGGNGNGVVLSFNPSINTENVLHVFNGTDGSNPFGRLVEDPDNGILYGVTYYGGSAAHGVIFSYNVGTSTFTKLIDITDTNDGSIYSGLTLVDTGRKDVGVSELRNKTEEVKVFPNPNNGKFTIQTELVSQAVIEVYNIFGQKIYQTNINANAIDVNLESQPNGVYFYRVVSYGGGLVGDGKIVIQK